jgi:hypothetical protein
MRIPSSRQSPRERFLNCMRGEPLDRVPLMLEGLSYSTREAASGEPDTLRRDVALRIHEQTHFEYRVPSCLNRYLVTPPQFIRRVKSHRENGNTIDTAEIETPRGALVARTGRNATSRTTWHVKYPVESLEDIDKIRSVPWELPSRLAPPDGTVPSGEFDRRGICSTGVSSPFVCVAGMMPYDYFLELCATELDLLRELTTICLERTLAVLDELLAERRIEYVWMGGCEWLTPPMGSPALYEDLVQRFEELVIRRVHDAGAVCHVHCHGRVRSTLERAIARRADFFEPMEGPPDGDITMAEAKALTAGRMALGGNVQARLLEKGSAEEVKAAARAAFEGDCSRMVLRNTAGPISNFDQVTHANYQRLVDVWEEQSAL